MKSVVWKFELKPQLEFWLDIPDGYEVLRVGHQRNRPMLWALVDPQAPKRRRKFRSILTGEKFSHGGARFLGTFLLYEGDFVAHLFEMSDAAA